MKAITSRSATARSFLVIDVVGCGRVSHARPPLALATRNLPPSPESRVLRQPSGTPLRVSPHLTCSVARCEPVSRPEGTRDRFGPITMFVVPAGIRVDLTSPISRGPYIENVVDMPSKRSLPAVILLLSGVGKSIHVGIHALYERGNASSQPRLNTCALPSIRRCTTCALADPVRTHRRRPRGDGGKALHHIPSAHGVTDTGRPPSCRPPTASKTRAVVRALPRGSTPL